MLYEMSSSKTRLRLKFFININRFYLKELWGETVSKNFSISGEKRIFFLLIQDN